MYQNVIKCGNHFSHELLLSLQMILCNEYKNWLPLLVDIVALLCMRAPLFINRNCWSQAVTFCRKCSQSLRNELFVPPFYVFFSFFLFFSLWSFVIFLLLILDCSEKMYASQNALYSFKILFSVNKELNLLFSLQLYITMTWFRFIPFFFTFHWHSTCANMSRNEK